MKKETISFKTNVNWSKDKCEITTSEFNVKNSNVTLLVDMKRGQYYVLPSENKKRNLESMSKVLKFLKDKYIDNLASYANIESLEYISGIRFNPNLDSNGELESRIGSMIPNSRKVLKVCLDNDYSINNVYLRNNI